MLNLNDRQSVRSAVERVLRAELRSALLSGFDSAARRGSAASVGVRSLGTAEWGRARDSAVAHLLDRLDDVLAALAADGFHQDTGFRLPPVLLKKEARA